MKFKKILSSLSFMALFTPILLPHPSYAAIGMGIEDVMGEEIWMGWTYFESGTEAYWQSGGDGGRAYGRYQFDYGYEVAGFIRYAYSKSPEKYTMLEKYITYGNNDPMLRAENGLGGDWKRAYNAEPEDFASLQDAFAYENNYLPAKNRCQRAGIDISDPVIAGTLYSLAIRDGAESGADMVIQNHDPDISAWLTKIYDAETRRHPSQAERWNIGQREAAMNGGMKMGTIGSVWTADGSRHVDQVSEWIEENPSLSEGFLKSGRWSDGNREWSLAIRTAGNWTDIYGIKGNALSFGQIGAVGGTVTDTERYGAANASSQHLTIPENGSSNPVIYIDQGAYKNVTYGTGGRTVSSSGCAIASFAMVASYLKYGESAGRDRFVSPAECLSKMDTAFSGQGGRNKDYVTGEGSIGDSIFKDLSFLYGFNYTKLGNYASSITGALSNGHLVIMAANGGTEFTAHGHFIVLTGYGPDGSIMVNDPNGAHANKSYVGYTASYLAECGHGFYEIWI